MVKEQGTLLHDRKKNNSESVNISYCMYLIVIFTFITLTDGREDFQCKNAESRKQVTASADNKHSWT